MRNHLKIMVRVRTIHYCNVCDYKTNRKYDKDKHVTRMHGLNIQHLKGVPGISNIKEQSIQIQNGLGTAYIPIEKYKEVCNATDQWKICYEKLQKEHILLQEHRREDGENSNAIITYLQNVLNANNIRYNLELA